jgi:hypothetical protein
MNWTQRYTKSHNDWCKRKSPAYYKAAGGDSMKVTYPKVTSSNGLTRAIINFLTWEGHHAERSNNMGRPIEKFAPKMNIFTGQVVQVANGMEWQKGTGTKGTSDIKADIVHYNYRFPIPVKIEVKWNKDRQSEGQKQYQQTIESKGGVYVIVKNIDDFFIWFDEFTLSL